MRKNETSTRMISDCTKSLPESMNKGIFQIIEDLILYDYKEYLEFVEEVNFQCQKHNIKLTGIPEGYRVWCRIDHSQVHVFDFLWSDDDVELVDPKLKEVDMAEFLMRYVRN